MKLILVGGTRNEDDIKRVESLKLVCEELHISNKVEFKENLPFNELLKLCGECKIGLHSMINEHFGISVVEMMSSGLITIANNSAGPKMDIIKENGINGYLCDNEKEYCDRIYEVLEMSEEKCVEMRRCGRNQANEFSEEKFIENFKSNFKTFLI